MGKVRRFEDAFRPRKRRLPPLEQRDYYTTEEAAARIGVQSSTMRDWRGKRTGPRWYRAGRRIFYKKAAVNEWIEANTQQTT